MIISDDLAKRYLLSMGSRTLNKQQLATEWGLSRWDTNKIIEAAIVRGEMMQVDPKTRVGLRWIGATYCLTEYAGHTLGADDGWQHVGGRCMLQACWTRVAAGGAALTR